MKRLFWILSFGLIVLAGCSSFNNSFNRYEIPSHPQQSESEQPKTALPVVLKDPSAKTSSPGVVCAPYQMPLIPKTPELPFKEILSNKEMTTSDLEQIERKHIDELRLFIVEMKKTLRQSHQQYMQECTNKSQ